MKTLVGCASLASVVAVVLLLYGGGRASDPLAVAVANAATRCPDGFTVNVHGLPAGSEPTSSLSETCVLDLGIPAGATGPPGPAGAIGLPGSAGTPGTSGVSGYALATSLKGSKSNSSERVKGSKSNSSERLAAVAKCPAGKKAIGGGASITGGRGEIFAITTSQPTPNGQGWAAEATTVKSGKSNSSDRVKGSKSNSSERSLKVTAICAVVS